MESESAKSEDDDEWLDIRVRQGRALIPVRISRRALVDHFGASDGQRSLTFLYVNNKEIVHRAVRAKMTAGWSYTAQSPLELRLSDFSAPTNAPDPDPGSSGSASN